MRRIRKNDVMYGSSHGSKDGYETVCGFDIDHNWYIAERGNVPYNYEELKRNKAYRNILKTNIGNRENYNAWIQFALSEMIKLNENLAYEIENR